MRLITPAVLLLLGSTKATCGSLTRSEGAHKSKKDGEVIENLYIYSPPDNDTALKISHKNVIVKNVVIHHAANSRGIYGWDVDGLTIENVEVIAYGVHASGPSPCPSRKPFSGYNCNNIFIYKADNLSIKNVSVEGGSKGISIQESNGAKLENVVAKNVRGPYPAGQCFQIARSNDVTMDGFHCLNEQGKSWTEDSISAWRSSNFSMKNGVVDGNNAETGICVMYEGSEASVSGGLVENVEARHCQGCFSGYPSNGLTFKAVTCADSWCDGTPERGMKRGGAFNLWNFGNNFVDKVDSKNNVVEGSFYYDDCPNTKLMWTADGSKVGNGILDKFDVQKLSTYAPKEAIKNVFPWTDSCALPDILCEDFPY